MVTSLSSLSFVSTQATSVELNDDPQLKKMEDILNKWLVEPQSWNYEKSNAARRMYQVCKTRDRTLTLQDYPYMEHLSEEALALMTHLDSIFFSRMNCCKFPAVLNTLTGLTFLSLADFSCSALLYPNPFVSIPFENLTDLRILILKETNLARVPPEVCQLTGLVKLTMMGNNLTSIPSALGALTNLTFLDVSRNSVEYPPAELGNLLELWNLDLCQNPIKKIPPEYGKLTKLMFLDFDCHRQEVPLSLAVLPMRGKAGFKLEKLIELWGQCRGKPQSFDSSLISRNEEIALTRWLLRLARSKELIRCQPQVAVLVCTMLDAMQENYAFYRRFFELLLSPRSSTIMQSDEMLLDEVYLLFQSLCLNKWEPLQVQFKMLEGVARTLALRQVIDDSTRDCTEDMKIEMFHAAEGTYYEAFELRKAVLQPDRARCSISESELKIAIDARYIKVLVTLPSFKLLARMDMKFIEEVDRIEKEYESKKAKENVSETELNEIRIASLQDIYMSTFV